ncbi:isoprenoid synthase domain-containing protein [Microdochium bolleyi]|uniref:Squalene synthase n=1 Tax=Microdochium bolleyi TaxID=196109 RepID=A0A136J221_9PEZI|nr:isoprenoid synthase domain-containing protein [Microdochium bolleyi]
MGGTLGNVMYYAFHPTQLRSIVQWKVWHEPVFERNPEKEAPTLRECFKYLDLTSRSFSAVIQELNPDMLVPIALFYLVLRGLDTIEDDMTIDLKTKEPLLRHFNDKMKIEGWTFTENGPNEKDRELLVHFDVVIAELNKVGKNYYDIIEDITIKMGNGMADYALNAEFNENGIQTIDQYEEYCHYVAGLVGDGLTRLFVEGKYANPALLERPELTESMGQFLQKTNIIRDVHEDYHDKRRFWPKDIWSKYVDNWDDLFKPENREKALNCSSEMVLNSLKHADECLFYMAGIKEQSVFNFVAIPQVMAIATIELIFRNPAIFERNVKITKGDACALMIKATQNLRVASGVFKDYVRKIAKKNDPRDPNFLEISAACGRIEQFIESIFPSQDAAKMKALQLKEGNAQQDSTGALDTFLLLLVVLFMMAFISALMFGAAYLMGARFNFNGLYQEITGLLSGQRAANVSSDLLEKAVIHEEL